MNRLRRLSITARITIGSLIVATLFGLVAVVVIRIGVAGILHNATVTLLSNDISTPEESVRADPNGPFDLPGGGQELAVVSADGTLLASTLPSAMEKRIDTLIRLEDTPSSFQLGDDQYLVLTHTIDTAEGPIHIVAARNDETTALILDRLTAALLIGAAVLILGFGGASWLLARAALRPVSRMREQAERIAGEERSRREESTGLLTVGPAEDELSALATTLNALIRRLRASAERERQMVSDASHELRTPLAVLRGQLELAELDAGDAESLLADIRSSHTTALRLGQLANNLLELSRIEAGPSSGRIDWRTFADELTDAVDRARLLVSSDDAGTDDEGRLSIDYDYDPRQRPDPDARVALSPTDVGRILDNLLGNAITAIRSASLKEATVTASLSVSGDNMVLSVRDTGPGMPADFIPVALDRFTRADDARTSRSGTGGGLGLAIVAALADAAAGEVVLANVEPSGLEVTVTLPLVRDAA